MYVTIHQQDMQSSINSGGFELQANEPQKMVNYALNMLNRFLNSNASLRLDNSFCIYFKVLSVQHVNYAFHRRGPLMVVGCQGGENTPGTLEFNTPDDEFFQNKCLIMHIALGIFKHEAIFSKNYRKFSLLLNICYKQKKQSLTHKHSTLKKRPLLSPAKINLAKKMLRSKVEEIIDRCHLPTEGPYNVHDVLPKIAEAYNFQVHIICGLHAKVGSLLSFPPSFDDSKTQIVLEKIGNQHVTLVSNLKMFFRHFNKCICFECSKTFYHKYKHICAKRKTCFACHRFFSNERTQLENDAFFKYCDGAIEANMLPVPNICDTCNSISLTISCTIAHKTLCGLKSNSKGRMGYNCQKCDKHFNLGFSNAEEARQNHVCNKALQKCYLCKGNKEENHQCPIKKETATKVWPDLAFYAFSFKALTQCKKCFLLRQDFKEKQNLSWHQLYQHSDFSKLVCDTHKLVTECMVSPNVAVIFKEIERGTFQKITLCEDQLFCEITFDEGFQFDYFPLDTKFSKQVKFQSKYNQAIIAMLQSLEKVKSQPKKSLIEKFLLIITQPEWQNTTFLSLNANNCANLAILKGLIDFDILPYVIETGNKINLISIDFLKIRFLNASAYLCGTLEEIKTQYNIQHEVYYFPNS